MVQSAQELQPVQKEGDIYYDQTWDLSVILSEVECVNCNQLVLDEHFTISAYSYRDRFDYFVYDDEIDLHSNQKTSRRVKKLLLYLKILSGSVRVFQLFRNPAQVKRYYIPLEISWDFALQNLDGGL